MNVLKRDGKVVKYNLEKIRHAIQKACVESDVIIEDFDSLLSKIDVKIKDCMTVEDIQDIVVMTIMGTKYKRVAMCYQSYRALKKKERDEYRNLMLNINNIYTIGSDDNSNKPSQLRNVKRDMVAGEVEKLQAISHIPSNVYISHLQKKIYWHDLDYSGGMPITNCSIIDVWDMLKNGTKVNNADIDTPNTVGVASTILSQIIANVAHLQYGGVSIGDFNEGLAIYAKKSFYKNFKYNCEYEGLEIFYADGDTKNIPIEYLKAYDMAKAKTEKDIYDACQTFEYQANSISSSSQTPFSAIMFNIPTSWESKKITESYFKVRMNGLGKKKKLAIFPKLSYVVVEGHNLNDEDEHFDLTELATECISKCFFPDLLNYSKEEYDNGTVYSRMGCRSRVNHEYAENGKPVPYGRFNVGVVSLNLVQCALRCIKDNDISEDNFFKVAQEHSNIMEEALVYRFNYVSKMKPQDAPILFQHGAICRKEDNENMEELFRSDRASISYGFVGIDDVVRLIKEKNIQEKDGMDFAKKIMEFLKSEVSRIREKHNIPVSIYGTPFESGIYSLFKQDFKQYGDVMPVWLLEREYYTNSYHFSSELETNAFDKIDAESELLSYASGGNIVYSEIGSVKNNPRAIVELMRYGYDKKIQYQGFNIRNSKCFECGFEGDIQYDFERENYICPSCGNTHNKTMSIVQRCCGLTK